MFIPMRQKVLNSDGRELKGQNFFILVGGERVVGAREGKWLKAKSGGKYGHFVEQHILPVLGLHDCLCYQSEHR